MTLTVGSLCSGYEATSLGLALAGWDHRLAFVADPDPAAAKVLAHHHPDVPNLGDITRVAWEELGLAGEIDLLTAGFPCTDISCAGRRAGLAEDIVIPAGVMPCGCPWADHQILDCVAQDRWGGSPAWNCEQGLIDQAAASVDWLNEQDLEGDGPPPERVIKGTRSGVWAHVRRCVDELRPPLVLIENVAALLSTPANRSTDGTDSDVEPGPADLGDGPGRSLLRAAGAVLGDLSELGYDAVWQVVSAAEVGAPHLRKRVFILAWNAEAEDRVHEILGRVVGPVRGDAAGPDGLILLPTPRATDGTKGGPNQRGSSGDLMLPSAVMQLLPTPTATPYGNNQSPSAGAAVRPSLNSLAANTLLPTPMAAATPKSKRALSASTANGRRSGGGQSSPPGLDEVALLVSGVRPDNLPPDEALPPKTRTLVESLLPTPMAADAGTKRGSSAGNGLRNTSRQIPERWGEYAPAIARWEAVIGRPAPDPTEPGKNGQPRLSPRFVEWLQGLDDGYVTAVPGISRNDALRLLGNANPPQQYAAAITQLVALVAHITAKELAA